MLNELTNLLPQQRRDLLRREYFIRLITVSVLFLVALTVVAAILLVPTYIFLVKDTSAKNSYLKNIETALASSSGSKLSAQLAMLSNSATVLKSLSKNPSVSAIVRDVLNIPRPGISISGFVYSPANKGPGTLIISGMAATRDALRNYQLALQNSPFASSADLPVSAYAKDSDISFTITVTLSP